MLSAKLQNVLWYCLRQPQLFLCRKRTKQHFSYSRQLLKYPQGAVQTLILHKGSFLRIILVKYWQEK